MPRTPSPNPFRIHGVATDEFFTDRAHEVARILKTLGEPGAKLLVYGPRRMGKTSAIMRAIRAHEEKGGVAFLADLSTASTLIDVANRILESSARTLGRQWKDLVNEFVSRLGVTLKVRPDPGSGLILPSLDVSLRSAPIEDQRKSLATTLDTIDGIAGSKRKAVGVVLDEFQEIQKLGGDEADWQLRGAMQHHGHLSYVLAGSESHLIERMLDKGHAFYGMLDHLEFGPIDPGHLARWIDERMTAAGVKAKGVGDRAVALAGPRTRDIVQVARRCFDNTRSRGVAAPDDATLAFDDVVAEQEPLLESLWDALTANQQNVLRAVAVAREGLTTRSSLTAFGMPSTGSAVNTAAALMSSVVLLRAESPTGYRFDSPFFGRWVRMNTLGDIGLSAMDA